MIYARCAEACSVEECRSGVGGTRESFITTRRGVGGKGLFGAEGHRESCAHFFCFCTPHWHAFLVPLSMSRKLAQSFIRGCANFPFSDSYTRTCTRLKISTAASRVQVGARTVSTAHTTTAALHCTLYFADVEGNMMM